MESSRIPIELIIATCVVITVIWMLMKCLSGIWSALFGQQYTTSNRSYSGINYNNTMQRSYLGSKKVIAIDTESVGAGPRGTISMLARVSLVDRNGRVFDKYVKPILPVTDYRTQYSGIREGDLTNGVEYDTIRQMVAYFIKDCILVGHDLKHDLTSLKLRHPAEDTRDTSLYRKLKRMAKEKIANQQINMWWNAMPPPTRNTNIYSVILKQAWIMAEKLTEPKPKLKLLAKKLLARDIQEDEHDSVEDARATMDIYLLVEMQWEVGVVYGNYDGCVSV